MRGSKTSYPKAGPMLTAVALIAVTLLGGCGRDTDASEKLAGINAAVDRAEQAASRAETAAKKVDKATEPTVIEVDPDATEEAEDAAAKAEEEAHAAENDPQTEDGQVKT